MVVAMVVAVVAAVSSATAMAGWHTHRQCRGGAHVHLGDLIHHGKSKHGPTVHPISKQMVPMNSIFKCASDGMDPREEESAKRPAGQGEGCVASASRTGEVARRRVITKHAHRWVGRRSAQRSLLALC